MGADHEEFVINVVVKLAADLTTEAGIVPKGSIGVLTNKSDGDDLVSVCFVDKFQVWVPRALLVIHDIT